MRHRTLLCTYQGGRTPQRGCEQSCTYPFEDMSFSWRRTDKARFGRSLIFFAGPCSHRGSKDTFLYCVKKIPFGTARSYINLDRETRIDRRRRRSGKSDSTCCTVGIFVMTAATSVTFTRSLRTQSLTFALLFSFSCVIDRPALFKPTPSLWRLSTLLGVTDLNVH